MIPGMYREELYLEGAKPTLAQIRWVSRWMWTLTIIGAALLILSSPLPDDHSRAERDLPEVLSP